MTERDSAGRVKTDKELKDMSLEEFFEYANEDLDLKKHTLSKEDKKLIEYFLNSKELDIKNLSDGLTKSIYFHDRRLGKYVPLTFQAFARLMSEFDYKVRFLEFIYKNLEFNIVTKLDPSTDEAFLYNIKFKNGTLISRNKEVVWTRKKELSFNTINRTIYINNDTLEWIKNHKQYKNLQKLIKGISSKKDAGLYFIDMLSAVFLPNALTSSIFWIKSKGGKGKSSFFAWFSELIGGRENVSNLKIDDFVPNKGRPNYNLPYLNGKIMNFDDDYSGQTITSSGFLKQFSTGKNRVQVDMKQNQPISFYPKASLYIATNEEPAFKSFDSGDARRNIVFEWEGDWESVNVEDFTFMDDHEFKKLFLTFVVYRALRISKIVNSQPEVYTRTGYFQHNMPESVKSTTLSIKTEATQNIKKIKDYLKEGFDFAVHTIDGIEYIDAKASHKAVKEFLSEIDDKINYKDFLKTLQDMDIILQHSTRMQITENERKTLWKKLK